MFSPDIPQAADRIRSRAGAAEGVARRLASGADVLAELSAEATARGAREFLGQYVGQLERLTESMRELVEELEPRIYAVTACGAPVSARAGELRVLGVPAHIRQLEPVLAALGCPCPSDCSLHTLWRLGL